MHRKKIVLTTIIIFVTYFSSLGFLYADNTKTTSSIVKEQGKAIVLIATAGEEGASLGSGFIIKPDGVIITNHHVIEKAKDIIVKLISGDIYTKVYLIDSDSRRDIAIIKIDGYSLPTVVLGNSDVVEVGEKVIAIGNPLGLECTVSDGIVSALRGSGKGFNLLQISTPISPGSSGGPLFNMEGEVIGITSAGIIEGQNLNFAVPINYARALISSEKEPKILSDTQLFLEGETTKDGRKLQEGICPNCKREVAVDIWKEKSDCPYCRKEFRIYEAFQPIKKIRFISGSIFFIQVQTQENFNRVGTINLKELLDNFYKVAEGEARLLKIAEEKNKEREELVKEIKKMRSKMFKKTSDNILLDKKVAELESFTEGTRAELRNMRDATFEAIMSEVKDAIESYGKEKDYHAIIDKSLGTVLPIKDSEDITDKILAELNKTK